MRQKSSIIPPDSQVFSGRTSPLWHDDLTVSEDEGLRLDGEHDTWCQRVAGRIPLARVYGPSIKVGLAELSSCFVVRSEHHYSKNERTRQSFRKHVFENHSNLQPCPSIPVAMTEHIAAEISSHLMNVGIASPLNVLDRVNQVLGSGSLISEGRSVYWASITNLQSAISKAWHELDPFVATSLFTDIFWAYAEPTLRLRNFFDSDRWGDYLGFVDLRTSSKTSPLALGLLVPPKAILQDHAVRVILGNYGPIFGGPSFESCAYSMHDPGTSGAECTQAAAINSLILLSDRGARLSGGYTLTYLGKKKEACINNRECVGTMEGVSNSISVTGLSLFELVSLLQDNCRVSVSPVLIPHGRGSPTAKGSLLPFIQPTPDSGDQLDTLYLASRLFEAYLDARCPAIVYVNSADWYRQLGVDASITQNNTSSAKEPHAVVVVGYRKPENRNEQLPGLEGLKPFPESQPFRIDSLIVNDPAYLPFLKVSAQGVFEAARQANTKEHMPFLFVTPDEIKLHAIQCIEALNGCGVRKETRVDYQTWRRFSNAAITGYRPCRYEIALVHSTDIVSRFVHSSAYPDPVIFESSEKREDILRSIEELRFKCDLLPKSLYWCVSCYDDRLGLQCLWAFNSSKEIDEKKIPWALSCYFTSNGAYPWLVCDIHEAQKTETVSIEKAIPLERVLRNGPSKAELKCSVMTSCSELELSKLASELLLTGDVSNLDLYVLRDVDIQAIQASGRHLELPEVDSLDRRSSAIIMSRNSNVDVVCEWVKDCLESTQISALATYFPHIVDLNQERHRLTYEDGEQYLTRNQIALRALCNTILLAIELCKASVMEKPIVEIVAGTILDDCSCNECMSTPTKRVFESNRDAKIKQFCEQILEVIRCVRERSDHPFWIAVELEPGDTYVFNSPESLEKMFRVAEQIDLQASDDFKLCDHLAVNLDIAHLAIYKASEGLSDQNAIDQILRLENKIVHAHISDNPGMHTRDQPLGSWSRIENATSFENRLISILAKIAIERDPENELPVSGAISLELEGCARLQWILRSLAAMKYHIRLASS